MLLCCWCATTVLSDVFAIAGGVVLVASSAPFGGFWLRGRRQPLANTLPDQDPGVVGAVVAAGRGMQEEDPNNKLEESRTNGTLVSLTTAAATLIV